MTRIVVLFLFALLFSCKQEKPAENKEKSITGISEVDDLTRQIFNNDQDPQLYFSRAEVYMKNKMYDHAIYDLSKAIGMDSLNPSYYHLLSDAYMDNINSKEALNTIERASKVFPERIPTLLKLSETQLILKQYENSMLTASKVLSLNPNEAEGYFMLGMNFRATEDKDRAINSFQTATEMNPELIDAWLILGELYEEKNDAIALQYYEGAITANPDDMRALHSKAFYLQNHNKIEEAISIYQSMIEKDKFYGPAFLNLGILHLERDSVSLAKDQFTILSRTTPQDYRGHFYLGLCNELLGEFDIARENLRNAQRLNPNDNRIANAIVRVSEKQGIE